VNGRVELPDALRVWEVGRASQDAHRHPALSRTCTVRFARGSFYQGEGRSCREVGVAHSVLIRMWFDNDLASELASSRRRHEANDIRFVLPALSSPMESLGF